MKPKLDKTERGVKKYNKERDVLWCTAIIATQKAVNGRLVLDVAEFLHWFNEQRSEMK